MEPDVCSCTTVFLADDETRFGEFVHSWPSLQGLDRGAELPNEKSGLDKCQLEA